MTFTIVCLWFAFEVAMLRHLLVASPLATPRPLPIARVHR